MSDPNLNELIFVLHPVEKRLDGLKEQFYEARCSILIGQREAIVRKKSPPKKIRETINLGKVVAHFEGIDGDNVFYGYNIQFLPKNKIHKVTYITTEATIRNFLGNIDYSRKNTRLRPVSPKSKTFSNIKRLNQGEYGVTSFIHGVYEMLQDYSHQLTHNSLYKYDKKKKFPYPFWLTDTLVNSCLGETFLENTENWVKSNNRIYLDLLAPPQYPPLVENALKIEVPEDAFLQAYKLVIDKYKNRKWKVSYNEILPDIKTHFKNNGIQNDNTLILAIALRVIATIKTLINDEIGQVSPERIDLVTRESIRFCKIKIYWLEEEGPYFNERDSS